MQKDFNKEVGSKIFKARKEKSMSRAALGQIVNLHESTIKRYEDGQIKTLDIEKMKEFAKALDISPEFLMGWETMEIEIPVDDLSKLADNFKIPMWEHMKFEIDKISKHITVYGKVCAGDGKFALEQEITTINNPYPNLKGELFALQIDGDSMDKVVQDGDYAIIKKQPILNNRDIAVILLDNEVGMIKRFFKVDDETIMLKPESSNPIHKPITFIGEEINRIQILGKFVGYVSPLMD